MPYFHAVALFEGRGSSLEETDQAVADLLTSVSHRRLRYFEHETTPGPAGPAGDSLHFVIFADFDVEAYTDEKAADLVDEILDAVSTDDIQYFSHGLLSGPQRVRRSKRAADRVADDDERETDDERRGSRGGRRRSTRGRGRSSTAEAETEAASEAVSEETIEEQAVVVVEEVDLAPAAAGGVQTDAQDQHDQQAQPDQIEEIGVDEVPVDAPPEEIPIEPETPPLPPSRSSASMQVKTAVTLRASELNLPANGEAGPDHDELVALATTEARRRHPELPGDMPPESDVASLPWGETVLTLTWSYDVPVPSADDSD